MPSVGRFSVHTLDREIQQSREMNLKRSINRIVELFNIFQHEVELSNKAGLFDVNRLSEDVLLPVLKDAFDCQFLRNLNTETRNFPGLDLGDDRARIAFQVTSDPGIEKIKETLSKVIHHRLDDRYDTIYAYVLTKRQDRYSKRALQAIVKNRFEFDPAKHILDSRSLVARIRELDFDTIRRIEDTMEVHFSNPRKYFLRPATLEKTEELTLTLMPIDIPERLWLGTLAYDRDEVVAASRETQHKLSPRASERDVVRSALQQRRLMFSCDWVVRSGQLLTFHDLGDETLPLADLVDSATVECMTVKRLRE